MILYHGTNTEIEFVDLEKCRPFKDFGKGFYTTEIYEQAKKMAARVSRIYGGSPVVNVFELSVDIKDYPGLNVLDFGEQPSEEWARFVMNNRNKSFTDYSDPECNFDYKYDIVIGPIADDDMTMLFRQYQNKMISFDMLIKGMTFKDVTNQISFHTHESLKLLKKAGTIK